MSPLRRSCKFGGGGLAREIAMDEGMEKATVRQGHTNSDENTCVKTRR